MTRVSLWAHNWFCFAVHGPFGTCRFIISPWSFPPSLVRTTVTLTVALKTWQVNYHAFHKRATSLYSLMYLRSNEKNQGSQLCYLIGSPWSTRRGHACHLWVTCTGYKSIQSDETLYATTPFLPSSYPSTCTPTGNPSWMSSPPRGDRQNLRDEHRWSIRIGPSGGSWPF